MRALKKVWEKLLKRDENGKIKSFNGCVTNKSSVTNKSRISLFPINRKRNRYIKEIDEKNIDLSLVSKIPIAYARKNRVIPLKKNGDELFVLCEDPNLPDPFDELRLLFKSRIKKLVADRRMIDDLINKLYTKELESTDKSVEKLLEIDETFHLESFEPKDLLEAMDEAPVIRFVNSLISQAIKERASDIHLEPGEKDFSIRFRIDGVLYNKLNLKRATHSKITSRIKLMAGMNIAEKRLPQDGRIKVKIAEKDVDIRVSTVPTTLGERVVMRLLDRESLILGLDELGLSKKNYEKIISLIKKPNGIILVTGPTGSGKTTTLYAILSYLNSPEKNIITIEDPVEYQLPGIGQIQVNPKIGLTFAQGLRSILRQDPDIILVGEIRDLETAEIAIQASLTGHLVFSTLHTNDASGAITRLTDMGIEPFLISSSVIAAVAQRLVRVLCPYCKIAYHPNREEIKWLGIEVDYIYKPCGCENCMYTGFRGRTAIYEILPISDEIRELIMAGADSNRIKQKAVEKGMETLKDDGAKKVLQGITSIEEVIRVSKEEEDASFSL